MVHSSNGSAAAGGAALKRAIHVAREQAEIPTDTELALRAGVHYDTLMNWYSGRTVPRPAEVKRVADALGVRLVALMDAYEGREPMPPALEEAIHELIAELRVHLAEQRMMRGSLDETTAAILRALGIARPPRAGPG